MAARSIWFKAASLLVLFVLVSANTSIARAQVGGPETPAPPPSVSEVTPTPGVNDSLEITSTAEATLAALPASFSISGTVTDKDGHGLPGMLVSDDQGRQAQTATDGSYSLTGLAPGDYQVRAVKQDLELIPYFRVVHVVDQNVTGVDFYPPQEPQPGYINTQPLPVNHAPVAGNNPPPAESDLDSQSAYRAGKPGTAYALDTTLQLGVTGVPYAVESLGDLAHINAPTALALDGTGHLWEAEEHGNRLVGLDSTTFIPNQAIGDKPGISYMDDYVYNRLTAAAVQPGSGFLWAGDTTRLVKYDPALAYPNQYKLQYPAANPWQSGSDNGHFSEIRGIAFNAGGSEMYVSDRFNQRIQVFDISGAEPVYVRTLGVTGEAGSDQAHFNQPWHIAYYDSYLYVADSQNHRIQKCPMDGATCSTVAGTGSAGFEANQLNTPTAVAVTSANLYITDSYNQRVIRCDFTGSNASNCMVFAGITGEAGSDSAHLRWPADVVVEGTQVYVADRDNHRILEFTDSGPYPVSPLRQLGTTGEPYVSDSTYLNRPWGIAVDRSDDSLYVAENWGYSLAKFDPSGTLLWRVPDNPGNYGSDLHHFGDFSGGNQGNLAVGADHRIYVPDAANHRVMVYLPDGTLFTQIGPAQGGNSDHLTCPEGVAVGLNSIYIVEPCNQRVQVFDLNYNYVATMGQTGVAGQDSSHFSNPVSVAYYPNTDSLYVVDQGNQRVQRCQLNHDHQSFTCAPFAGVTGVSGGRNFRYLNRPSGVAVDSVNKKVFISEEDTSRVQVFDLDGAYLTTISGEWGDQGGRVRLPSGLAVDSHGAAYVADRENARILRFNTGVPDWIQINVNGFGEQSNGGIGGLTYATVLYKNAPTSLLYAATADTADSPLSPQVWRRLPDDTWQAVSAPGFGLAGNSQLTDLAGYHNDLYAGTLNNSGGQVWRCLDLTVNPCEKQADWTQVIPPLSLSSHNTMAGRMVEFNGLLFVSFTNWYDDGSGWSTDGGEVWSYDGTNWNGPLLKLDAGATSAGQPIAGIQALAVYSDVLYAGTNDPQSPSTAPAQLWRCAWASGACTWEKVKDSGITDTHNSAISSLTVFDGKLYAGVTNALNGAMIYRYDSNLSTDEVVVSGGLNSVKNQAIRAMVAGFDQIYAILSNDETGLQMISSPSGDAGTWSYLSTDFGFGNSANTSAGMDSSATLGSDGRLIVGTWNEANGGAVWLYAPPNAYAYHISGSVYYNKSPRQGTYLTLQPGGHKVVTDSTGVYLFDHLLAGVYTITASDGYLGFTPPSQKVTINGASADNINFIATYNSVLLTKPADGTQFTSLDPVTLEWEALYGMIGTRYNLQISTNKSFTALVRNVTQTGYHYKFKGLLSKKTYYWRVRRTDVSSATWTIAFTFRTPKPPAAPVLLIPANGAALPAAMLAPNFTWKASVMASGAAPVQYYQIQVSRQNTFTALDLDENTLNASTLFTPPSVVLKPNQVYYWRLRAFNTLGDSSLWSSGRSFKILPAAPANGVAYDTNTLLPGFHWSDPYCAGRYLLQVYKGTNPTHMLVKSATITTGAACEGDFKLTTSLLVNTLYEWRVMTLGVTGRSSPLIHTFTTPASLPGVPVLLGPANNEIIPDATYPDWWPTFSWLAVTSGAPAYYQIQLASQTGFGSSTFVDEIVVVPHTSYSLASWLKYNASVYWRVRACNDYKNCSLWTTVRKLITRPGRPYDLNWHGDTLDTVIEWVDPGSNPANSYSLVFYKDQPACATPWKTATSATTSAHVVLDAEGPYCVKVRGVGPSASITGDYSSMLLFGPTTTPPAPALITPPDNALISASTSDSKPYLVFFSWSASPGADNYDLEVSTATDFTNLIEIDRDPTLTTATVNLGCGNYYWRVRAIPNGQSSSEVWSSVRSFSTLCSFTVYVYNEGSPMNDAQVTVSGVSSLPVTSRVFTGQYFFSNVPIGTHTVTVSKADYLPQTHTVTVTPGVSTRESFSLAHIQNTPGVLRIVMTWNPHPGANLRGSLWLPSSTPLRIVLPNVGKTDLNVFPHAFEISHPVLIATEIYDVRPPADGKYVFAVNLLNPDSASWSGVDAKAEVYSGATLLKRCPQPSGSASWWYAFDLTVSGGKAAVTCKNSMQPAWPGPYKDNPISGYVRHKNSNHPAASARIDYDTGTATADQNGFYTITGIVTGSYTLTPHNYTSDNYFLPARITVAAGTSQVNFLYVSNPPFNPGALAAEAIRGDYAYLGIDGWFCIVNIHDKFAPREVSRLWIDGNQIKDIVLSGSYAYLAVYGSEVNVVDVSDPAHPRWVSLAPVAVYNTAIYGPYIILSSGRYLYIYKQSGSSVIPITTLDLGNDSAAYAVAVSSHYAYLVGGQGLYIYDISDPAHPAGPWRYPFEENYFHLLVDGKYAYLGSRILDVSDPTDIKEVEIEYPWSVGGEAVAKNGNLLYVIGSKGLTIVDVSNPVLPVKHGSVSTIPEAYDADVQGNYVFVIYGEESTDNYMYIVDATNIDAPVVVTSYRPSP